MPSDFNEFWQILLAILGFISLTGGIYLAWSNRNRQTIEKTTEEVKTDEKRNAEIEKRNIGIEFSVEYIKRGVDDLRFDIKAQNEKFEKYTQKMDEKYEKLNEKIIVIEESVKVAHKRIDTNDDKLNRIQTSK